MPLICPVAPEGARLGYGWLGPCYSGGGLDTTLVDDLALSRFAAKAAACFCWSSSARLSAYSRSFSALRICLSARFSA